MSPQSSTFANRGMAPHASSPEQQGGPGVVGGAARADGHADREDTVVAARELSNRFARHDRWFVLTGAGCSTESGIPAYRDESGAWRHKPPIQLREFVGSESVRRRYWARSFLGFPRVQRAVPNAAHHALAELEQQGRLRVLVTQNVDQLHQKAGSRNVIDLHGQLAWVACLGCRALIERERMQGWLAAHNPTLSDPRRVENEDQGRARLLAPDGDAQLEEDASEVQVPPCPSCGGMLKPDVVFFGETVPPQKVRDSYAALEEADAVLVVGSSLAVFSGYRFVRRAAELSKPIVVVNSGATRADTLAELKLGGSCGALLSAAVQLLPGAV
ncbi:MAG: hypothetical protein RL685_6988 [Pseudomonadota bacterium]